MMYIDFDDRTPPMMWDPTTTAANPSHAIFEVACPVACEKLRRRWLKCLKRGDDSDFARCAVKDEWPYTQCIAAKEKICSRELQGFERCWASYVGAGAYQDPESGGGVTDCSSFMKRLQACVVGGEWARREYRPC